MSSRYLTTEQLAERWQASRRAIEETTRRNRVPLRRFPGTRRILIPLDDPDLLHWLGSQDVVGSAATMRVARALHRLRAVLAAVDAQEKEEPK